MYFKIFILSHFLWSQTVSLQCDKMWFYLYLCGVPSVYYICNWMIFTSFGKFSIASFQILFLSHSLSFFFWIYTYMLLELFTMSHMCLLLFYVYAFQNFSFCDLFYYFQLHLIFLIIALDISIVLLSLFIEWFQLL